MRHTRVRSRVTIVTGALHLTRLRLLLLLRGNLRWERIQKLLLELLPVALPGMARMSALLFRLEWCQGRR